MSTMEILNQHLQPMLTDARVTAQTLPDCQNLKLWLLDPLPLQRPFSAQEVHTIEQYPAYWGFCWASGLALAQLLLKQPQLVAGKRVLDFGAGSGVIGIASLMAGAQEVIFCDIDEQALDACRANIDLNGWLNNNWWTLGELTDDPVDGLDMLIAADVLYDRANLPLLSLFQRHSQQVLIADSRVKQFNFPPYQAIGSVPSCTLPDLDESQEFRQVRFYRTGIGLHQLSPILTTS